MDHFKENLKRETRLLRTSTSINFDYNIATILEEWRKVKYIRYGDKAEEWMPKEMPHTSKYRKQVHKLNAKVNAAIYKLKAKHSFISEHASMISSIRGTRALGGLKLAISDIIYSVPSFAMVFQEHELANTFLSELSPISSRISRYKECVQVVLRPTNTILLYEHNSETVLRQNTRAAARVIQDNLVYDYLTIGDGRFRGRKDSEAQTNLILSLHASVGTQHVEQRNANNFTSNYEIYDKIQHKSQKTNFPVEDTKAYLNALANSTSFAQAVMYIERGLSINSYIKGQMHYRNILNRTGSPKEDVYSYNIKEIFRFTRPRFENLNRSINQRKAVADISFCFGNADLVAVAYGMYSYTVQVQAMTGNVCVWNIKNVLHPERTYSYNSPVTAVEFSPFDHSLLAVGMANGRLEVRDISVEHKLPLTNIEKSALTGNDPVIAIKWFREPSIPDTFKHFIALSRNAVVRRYRFSSGSHIFTTQLIHLTRVRGEILQRDVPLMEQFSHSILFCYNLTLDPLNTDLYYVLTDQGYIQNCSMTVDNSFSSSLRTHTYGSVNCMEFSPWSPKIFLTCGNDWFVRIWMVGVTQPLLELTHQMFPVHYAAWSPTQSTTIFSLTRKTLDIWDIRAPFKPIQCVNVSRSHHTLFKTSPTGTALMIGNEYGDVIVCGVGETIILSKFQYDTMEHALYNAIKSDTVRQLVKEAGFFGYVNKRNRRVFPKVYARI